MQFTLNRKSWHYWIANKFSNFNERRVDDFCTYFWCVLRGTLMFLALLTFAALYLYGLADFIAWFIAGLTHGFVELSAPGFISAFISGTIGGLFLIGYTLDKIYTYRAAKREKLQEERRAQGLDPYAEPEPGFLKLAYRKLKNKTCVRLKFA